MNEPDWMVKLDKAEAAIIAAVAEAALPAGVVFMIGARWARVRDAIVREEWQRVAGAANGLNERLTEAGLIGPWRDLVLSCTRAAH